MTGPELDATPDKGVRSYLRDLLIYSNILDDVAVNQVRLGLLEVFGEFQPLALVV